MFLSPLLFHCKRLMASSISLLYCLGLGIIACKICHNSVTLCRRYLQPGVTFTRPSLLGGRWPCFALEPAHSCCSLSEWECCAWVRSEHFFPAKHPSREWARRWGNGWIGVAERALSRSLPLNLPHCVLLLLIYHHYYISLGNDHSASFYWEKNFYMIVFFRDERPLSEAVWCKPFVWNLLS